MIQNKERDAAFLQQALKITTELSPALELTRYLKSDEKFRALAAEPVA